MKHDKMCFCCGSDNPKGLGLDFKYDLTKGVSTCQFMPSEYYQSYENILHGGIQATILDGAMVNVLKSNHIDALTGKLEVYYKKTVFLNEPITVLSNIAKKLGDIIFVESQIIQNGEVKTEGKGIFKKSTDLT